MCNNLLPPTSNAASSARTDIMLQITQQANSVRKTFEDVKPRKAVSSSTAAAAAALASMNSKRKADESIDEQAAPTKKQATTNFSRFFHSSITHHLTRTMAKSQSITTPSVTPDAIPTKVSPPTVLPTNLTSTAVKKPAEPIQVTKNDVVCAGDKINDLIGNKRFNVWIDLHSKSFSKAPRSEDQIKIARSIVNTVQACVPQGRFLSKEVRSGKLYIIDDEKAVRVTLSVLQHKTNCNGAVQVKPPSSTTTERKTFASMAA